MRILTDPLFDSIKDESGFQQIVRDIEAKYQAEHERVKKWLEEQGCSPGSSPPGFIPTAPESACL